MDNHIAAVPSRPFTSRLVANGDCPSFCVCRIAMLSEEDLCGLQRFETCAVLSQGQL